MEDHTRDEGQDQDDVTFEVTDLRTGAQIQMDADSAEPQRRAAPGRAPRQIVISLDGRTLRRTALAAGTLLALLIVLASIPPVRERALAAFGVSTATPGTFSYAPISGGNGSLGSQSHSSISISVSSAPAATPTATAPLPTQAALPVGPAPANCNGSPTAPSVGPPADGAIGAGSVWVDGFAGSSATISILGQGSNVYTPYGWRVTIILAFKIGFSQPVTLRGFDVSNGHPLWFSFQGDSPETLPTQAYTLNPATANDAGQDGTATFWGGTIYLPGAGCYALSASWQGNGWKKMFAAGS